MSPERYVQDKAAPLGSSAYYAFLFLPPKRRAAITAFQAFCREIGDVVDEVGDAGVAAHKLAWWQREVTSAFHGSPNHPVMHALLPHCEEFGIVPGPLFAIIDGHRMDLERSRILDFAALAHHCHRVAGVAGEVAANIYGATDPRTTSYAHRLGLAMHLSRVVRNVGADARHGRLYLPADELARFGVEAREIIARSYSERFTALMKFQAERAHRTYDEAFALLPAADRRAQLPGLTMANIDRALLREIEAVDFQVLHQRISLTPLRKLWIATRTRWRGR